jgi:single-stranded-DNA-specific exonuclease
VFTSSDLGVLGIDKVGRDKNHLVLKLVSNDTIYKAIFFDHASLSDEMKLGDKVDIVFTPEINVFKDKEYLNLVIKDLRIKGA